MKNRKTTGRAIDGTDCEIIQLLQKDGRITNIEIARKLKVSEATVRARMKRLIDAEIIQIVAVSNPINLGFRVTGSITIRVDIKKMKSVIRELKKIEALWFIVQVTSGTGIYTEFVVRSMEELNELIMKKINLIDGVLDTETNLIMKFIKRKYDWGTALD
jgi:Lrp/AsnC family transcriptional regulator for asnA, asnC and gidA